jgi:hypothetical protein
MEKRKEPERFRSGSLHETLCQSLIVLCNFVNHSPRTKLAVDSLGEKENSYRPILSVRVAQACVLFLSKPRKIRDTYNRGETKVDENQN